MHKVQKSLSRKWIFFVIKALGKETLAKHVSNMSREKRFGFEIRHFYRIGAKVCECDYFFFFNLIFQRL